MWKHGSAYPEVSQGEVGVVKLYGQCNSIHYREES